ncbi:hypothetical protein GPECTOR_501g464 [Gonium pectorale]|uniref:Preprotein translocase subunit SecY n=1 Tax=Gonium pectorale TaxID=33097 RepID=A0A150FUW3_GONPE|nr:hypothetical protein GPECTOR_501g464 [Gonium pectorale]|eukprot:KXZ41387.1 hypothetical protein GPECTOR_501g464 [Gonium pectorale]
MQECKVSAAAPGWDGAGGGPPASASTTSAPPLPLPWPLSAAAAWLAGRLAAAARFCHYYHEVLGRAALTLGLLALIRAGHFIPLPGVDLAAVPAAGAATAGERLIKALYGQAGDLPASLFDLGISPFVNASIVLAICLVLPAEAAELLPLGIGPWLGRLREARREGRSGEAVLNSASNTMALGFAVYGGLMRALELQSCALYGGGGLFVPLTVLSLVAGSCIIHMAASTITAFGLGNGSSLMNVGLRGVVPGVPTERELRLRLLQCKAWGGACLGLLAVGAQCFDSACVAALGTSLGTTSLLIIVGAVLQTARQVEGLLEGPKLQQRLDREREAIQSLKLL